MEHDQAASRALESARDAFGVIRTALTIGDLDDLMSTPPELREFLRSCRRTAVYHRDRAKGLRNEKTRLAECGTKTLEGFCRKCRVVHRRMPKRCDVALLCARCGFTQKRRRQARFGLARGRRWLDARSAGLFWGKRPGGRFGDKMLTATTPHFDGAAWLRRYYGMLDEVRDFDMESLRIVRAEARRMIARWKAQSSRSSRPRMLVTDEDVADARATLDACKEDLKLHRRREATLARMRSMLERRQQDARGPADGDVSLRVAAIHAAWPLFLRAMRAVWLYQSTRPEERKAPRLPPSSDPIDLEKVQWSPDATSSTLCRMFEWTCGSARARAGGDTGGHPHFHLWLFAPWIPHRWLQAEWSAALRAVGVPLYDTELARLDLRTFTDFDGRAVAELMKGGATGAVKLARFKDAGAGPANAHEYAEGFSIAELLDSDDYDVEQLAHVRASIHRRRKTQASKGFFKDVVPPSACGSCGAEGARSVRTLDEPFLDRDDPKQDPDAFHVWVAEKVERGPP